MKPWFTGLLCMLALPVFGWQAAHHPQPAAPQRLIPLKEGASAAAWARQQALSHWQRPVTAGAQPYLTARIAAADWQVMQQACGEACQTDSCQGVRTLHAPVQAQTWLVPNAPPLQPVLAGNEQTTDCPANLQAQPWQGQWPAGSAAHCWRLQLSRPCRLQQTPAHYLQEQWHPERILVSLASNGPLAQAFASRYGLTLLQETALSALNERLLILQRPAGGPPLAALLTQLQQGAGVNTVQRELAYFTFAEATEVADPLAHFNYGPGMTASARLAPDYTGKAVKVAVIDTGLDSRHPELSHTVVHQQDFTGQGYTADSHGTAVAAIVAGARGNGVGASGVAPDVQLYSLKACHPHQPGGLAARCWSSSLIKAIDAAIERKVSIINLSLGGPPSAILHRLVQAAERQGLLVVSAAGNGGPNARPVYPAAWSEALAVTAIGMDRQLYRMANRGRYIQLAAPGVDIITAGPAGALPMLSGTSMAAAHISGLAAQLKQIAPTTEGGKLTALLLLGSEDLGVTGPDPVFGNGLVNACRSAMGLADLAQRCASELPDGGP